MTKPVKPHDAALSTRAARSDQALRWTRLAALVAAPLVCLTSACLVPATNPCDPDTPVDQRDTVTLSGTVRNQFGTHRPGIQVTLRDTGLSVSSGTDGEFTFNDVPQRPEGYEVIAVVPSPATSGTTITGPVGCGALGSIDLYIAEPPRSPELEITKATAPDRLFVAFNQTNTEAVFLEPSLTTPGILDEATPALRYRVQVRQPFGAWNDAAVRAVPVRSGDVLFDDAGSSVDDGEARDACQYFSYAFSELAEQVARAEESEARCAEVVGVYVVDIEGNAPVLEPLEPYATYKVRVRAEVEIPEAIRHQSLPSVVTSADGLTAQELTLTPTAEMPVALGTTTEENDTLLEDLDIRSLAPVTGQRFAAIDGDGLVVLDTAATADPEMFAGDDGLDAPAEGFGIDDGTTEDAGSEVTGNGARAISMLPAGPWVRVWKDLSGGSAMVDKIWIGPTAESTAADPTPDEMTMPMDMADSMVRSDFQGIQWLTPPGDPNADNYNPPDAYILKFERGLVLMEQRNISETDEAFLGGAVGSDAGLSGGQHFSGSTAEGLSYEELIEIGPDGKPVGDYLCNMMAEAGGITVDEGVSTAFGACFDIRQVDRNARLTDVIALTTHPDFTDAAHTVHLISDGASDKVFWIDTPSLFGAHGTGALNVAESMQTVRVGLAPFALQPSFMPTCGANAMDTETRTPVVVTANRGSSDLSILVASGNAASGYDVQEEAVIALPAAPLSFFTDTTGPTCADPYLWVVLEDGRMVPVDMRSHRLSVPACGDDVCAVSSRNRAQAGAVARDEGRSRVLFGGLGTLAEVGYLRPSIR